MKSPIIQMEGISYITFHKTETNNGHPKARVSKGLIGPAKLHQKSKDLVKHLLSVN